MNSRVRPKYKTRYRVTNWREYEQGLVLRWETTVWLSPTAVGSGPHWAKRSAPHVLELGDRDRVDPEARVQPPTAPVRGPHPVGSQPDGGALEVPDDSTLSRRSGSLEVSLGARSSAGPIDLIIDSSGLAVVGEGEWAAAKHGGRGCRGWKKLHLGVDATGEVVAQVLTDSTVHDATTGVEMINGMADEIGSVTADAAYETRS